MSTDHASKLAGITRLNQLIPYLRDEMGWPIDQNDFEDVDDLFYDFTPEELGLDPKTAAKIESIRRLRPLSPPQPWGIFFVKFEPKRLPVVALRRILAQVAMKKRPGANSADRAAWAKDDLLFVSNYGAGEDRQITFAHFSAATDDADLPTLRVLGWDNRDTALHLKAVANDLKQHLAWPHDDADLEAWRQGWRGAFSLRHGEVVTTSKQLSVRLARLAGDIRDRIKSALAIETERGPLTKLMKAFQTSLVHDLDADGFADMYAQTIAYGLLSARISDPHKKTVDDFAGHMRTNPFLRELMETFLKVGGRRGKAGGPGIDFDELGVSEVVQLLNDDETNMEAVVRDFGDRNPQEDPVIHFYELFLKEYDAKKRMQRGVFYTPRPVVSYIVRAVDELLRTELGLEDGLADTTTWGEMAKRHSALRTPEGTSSDQPFVQVLDPATGTGTFLVEAIDLIYETMVGRWRAKGHNASKVNQLWNEYVPKHLLPRLHGYELLMAPYAIAHLKIGLKLLATGYRFEAEERARVYLTNALEPGTAVDQVHLAGVIPALAHEAGAVSAVKKNLRFTVIFGNPPYSKSSSNREAAAEELVEPFKVGVRGERNIQPLSDDYVKFMGLALAASKRVPVFVFGMISNRGYLQGLIHRGMRQTLAVNWPRLWIADLHGDSNVGERAPDGLANDNVFDIQQGVAITLGVKHPGAVPRISLVDEWGSREQKHGALSALRPTKGAWVKCPATKPHFFFAAERQAAKTSERVIALQDAMPVTNTGIKTHRDGLVVDFDPDILCARIERFVGPGRSDSVVREEFFGAEGGGRYPPGDNRDWSMVEARKKLRSITRPLRSHIREIDYRPFDRRVIFYSSAAIDFAREELMQHMEGGRNMGLASTRQVPNGEFCHVLVTRRFIEMKTCSHDRGTNLFPLWLRRDSSALPMGPELRPNFSPTFLTTLATAMGCRCAGPHGCPAGTAPEDVFGYVYAILHSPGYRRRYADVLRVEFAPIPIPGSKALFDALASRGTQLVALHLMEATDRAESGAEYFGPRNTEIERVSWADGTVWLDGPLAGRDGSGQGTVGFRRVPEAAWTFRVGGYQVCEKWLKDRKGRTLTRDDVAHYQRIVAALSETVHLMQDLDAVIELHGGWPGAFLNDSIVEDLPKVAESSPGYSSPPDDG